VSLGALLPSAKRFAVWLYSEIETGMMTAVLT
jgi:hypothetical protein